MNSKKNKSNYKKAIAAITYFSNDDVITTSGFNVCEVWSSINGYECHMNLQLSGDGLKPPLD